MAKKWKSIFLGRGFVLKSPQQIGKSDTQKNRNTAIFAT